MQEVQVLNLGLKPVIAKCVSSQQIEAVYFCFSFFSFIIIIIECEGAPCSKLMLGKNHSAQRNLLRMCCVEKELLNFIRMSEVFQKSVC